MAQIAEQDFTSNLFRLLKETFEGAPAEVGSAYLDKGGGLFQILAPVTAETASRVPSSGGPTIAAHCAHISYYVRTLRAFMTGQTPQVDWSLSWETREVSAEKWKALLSELRGEYEGLRATLDSVETWGDDPVGDSMAIVVHTAYHLGAIRQVLRAVE